jgi:Uma2 family endonuclease
VERCRNIHSRSFKTRIVPDKFVRMAPGDYHHGMTTTLDDLAVRQHLTLSGVSWAYYESTLEQIGDRPIRVSFLDGQIEIMSPLPEHEVIKKAAGRLVEALTEELGLPCKSFGSTTFRREEKSAGTEPDECYYFRQIDSVKGMKRFDPLVHPAPELAIEVDVLSPSIPREAIYARLGVAEIWRFNGEQLKIRLFADGVYHDSAASWAFPFLPISEFAKFIKSMADDDETRVLKEFRAWLRTLPPR